MTVSVTGATGFIGRRLVQRLRAGKMIHLLLLMTFLTLVRLSYEFYWYLRLDTNFSNFHSADNHSIRVLTRSKSKAEQIFPGKKVMTILLLFY